MIAEHARIDLERKISVAPDIVWRLLTDAKTRAICGPGPAEVLQFTHVDTRIGGQDVHLCGPKDDPAFEVTTLWHRLDAPEAACFTEVLRSSGGVLAASQVDYALVPDRSGVQLTVTIWASSFVGPGMIGGFRDGWQTALDTLKGTAEAKE